MPIDLFFQEWPMIHKMSCSLPSIFLRIRYHSFEENYTTGQVPLEFLFNENGKKLRLTIKEKIAVSLELCEQLNSTRNKIIMHFIVIYFLNKCMPSYAIHDCFVPVLKETRSILSDDQDLLTH